MQAKGIQNSLVFTSVHRALYVDKFSRSFRNKTTEKKIPTMRKYFPRAHF